MSVQAAQEAKQTDGERQDREGIDGGAAGETESAETQEEEKRERRNRAEGGKERKTLHTSGEEHRKPGARACTGEGEEPSLRSFRPLARQTALRSAQKSRAFCSARSSLHLRTDPFARCHRTLRSVRAGGLYADAPVGTAAGDYRGSRRTSRSPYLTRTMRCRV